MTDSRSESIDKTVEKLSEDHIRSILKVLIDHGISSEDLGIDEDYRLYCKHSGNYYDEIT